MGEQYALAEIVLAGNSFRWSLGLLAYEQEHIETGYDGNWIDAEIDFTVERFGGRYTARQRLSVTTTDLLQLTAGLSALLVSPSGEFEYEFMEGQAGLVVALGAAPDADADFDVDLFVLAQPSPELRVRELALTKRELKGALHTMREATRAFPVRGNPQG